MDEPIDVTCHRCGHEFRTCASTRTTCRDCRAAVTVRRDGASRTGSSDSEVNASLGIGAFVALLIVVGWCIWRGGGSAGVGD